MGCEYETAVGKTCVTNGESSIGQSVLLFPPVNNFRRFLIHQTCENFRNKYDLFTFSVGQGPFRRTVICFKSQLLDPHKYIDSAAATNFETRHKSSNISTLKNWRSDKRRVESLNNSNNLNKYDLKMGVEQNIIETNKLNKQNSGDFYRPPALRSQIHETIKKNAAVNKEIDSIESSSYTLTNTSHSQSPSSPTLSIKTTTSISCSNSPIHRNENVKVNNVTTSAQQTTNKTQQLYTLNKQEKQQQRQQPQQQVRRERRPDRAVYIPRARRSQTTPPNTTTSQIQPLPQHEALSTQLHTIAPTQITNASKCLSQQVAITSDDKTAALVKQKPLTKADEVSKANISDVNTHGNIRTSNTIIKKKEKLSKENKELRDQRREQRLLKKFNTEQIVNISENYEKHNVLHVGSLSTKLINDDVREDHSINQEDFINAQQIYSSSVANDVNHLSEVNNYFNASKGFNCDTCEQIKENELLDSNAQNIAFLNVIKQESDESANTDISVLNDCEISQCINSPILYHRSNTSCDATTNDIIATNIVISNNNNNNTMPKPSNKTKSNKINNIVYNITKMPNLRIDDSQSPTKCDIEEQELQRASKEINRSNRRIIKQTFVSDVLQIPDHINEEENSEGKSEVKIINQRTSQLDSATEEEEEDDWESMYNESGDCLDPKIMQELTASVGKCKIELPKMDYSAYLTKQSILNEEEFPHVLEVSNFPVEFKNQDLLMVFSQYKESGFDIKWVDDTHALAVFSSSRIAAEVLTMGHPFVVLKPLAEATVESRLKAKKCAASLQPYRPRPETCAALARRLVTGALGVRLKTAAAERENEKRVLREAKERKLLAAKQRDEVWES